MYHNSPECRGYFDMAKMMSKLIIFGDWVGAKEKP